MHHNIVNQPSCPHIYTKNDEPNVVPCWIHVLAQNGYGVRALDPANLLEIDKKD